MGSLGQNPSRLVIGLDYGTTYTGTSATLKPTTSPHLRQHRLNLSL